MKTSTEKCSEKEVLWNKGVQKTVVKIHRRYSKVVFVTVTCDITPSQVFLMKFDI